MPLERRDFLTRLAAFAPFAVARRRAAAQAAVTIDPAGLRALAEVVLPSELGPAGVEAAVTGFGRWLRGYRPGVELLHGYGSSEIRRTPPSPAERWMAQQGALDAAARRRFGRGFASLPIGDRLAVVQEALAAEKTDRMPTPLEANHLAVGLLAWWAGTPGATDLCYQARIGKLGCRPLSGNPEPPSPLG